MRKSTRLTRPLQIGLAASQITFVVYGWILLVRPIGSFFQAGDSFRSWVLISAWLLWTAIAAILCLGAVRKWRWTFWAYLLFLVFLIISSVRGPNTTSFALASAVVTSAIALPLLAMSIVGLVRFGPWAMKSGD